MADQEISYDIYQPFGPSILKVKMPQSFVNLFNAEADRILYDEKLSKKYDWSHNLAGNVKKEVAIDPSKIKGFPEFMVTMSDQYLQRCCRNGQRMPKSAFACGLSANMQETLIPCIFMTPIYRVLLF